MSRVVVLGCMIGLMCAGPLCQADDALAFMATINELDDPGTVDPIDPPRDHPGDTLTQKAASVEATDLPSFLDGPVPLPGLIPVRRTLLGSGRDAGPPHPSPLSSRVKRSWLQVYRN